MYCKRKLKSRQLIKRLRLGNTTGRQHRFSDLTILSPIWLGTYEYMKSTLEKFFFSFWNRASRVNFSDLIKNFQIWPCFSDPVFVYMKKSLFWAFWGPVKVSRPLDITKVGAGSEKTPKNWIGCSSQPKMCKMNFRAKNSRNRPFCILFWWDNRSDKNHSSTTNTANSNIKVTDVSGARKSGETRPKNIRVVYIMKVF